MRCQIISSRFEYPEKVRFYSNGSSVMVDNSVNAHSLSEERMLTDKIYPIISNGVATVGEKYLVPRGICTVIWS